MRHPNVIRNRDRRHNRPVTVVEVANDDGSSIARFAVPSTPRNGVITVAIRAAGLLKNALTESVKINITRLKVWTRRQLWRLALSSVGAQVVEVPGDQWRATLRQVSYRHRVDITSNRPVVLVVEDWDHDA